MSPIPFCDIASQDRDLLPLILERIRTVCNSGRFTSGKEVLAFEETFARYCESAFCVGVNSGTSALHLALRCLDIGPGDEVITVPLTFIATVWAIRYVGARPVFVDVDPGTRTLAPERLKAAITPRTKAIIPVHLHGQPANLEAVCEIGRQYGLAVIEDAAQAHGARYRSKRVGSIGRIGCFSFYPTKNLGAYGEAGALVTNDQALDCRLRSQRDHAQSEKYHHRELGFNYRMDEFQAIVLHEKLARLDVWNTRRQEIADWYQELLLPLADRGLLELPPRSLTNRSVYHQYVILTGLRDSVAEKLAERGIATGLHYRVPAHLQEAIRDLGYQLGDFPESERIARSCLSLPIYPSLKVEQVRFVAQTLGRALWEDQEADLNVASATGCSFDDFPRCARPLGHDSVEHDSAGRSRITMKSSGTADAERT